MCRSNFCGIWVTSLWYLEKGEFQGPQFSLFALQLTFVQMYSVGTESIIQDFER